MTEQEFEAVASQFDSAMRHIEEAIGKLEEIDRIGSVDVKQLLDRLYDIGGDIELEMDAIDVDIDALI